MFNFFLFPLGAGLDKSSSDGEETLWVHCHCLEGQQNHQVRVATDTHHTWMAGAADTIQIQWATSVRPAAILSIALSLIFPISAYAPLYLSLFSRKFYADGAIVLREEASVLTGLLIGLGAIDFRWATTAFKWGHVILILQFAKVAKNLFLNLSPLNCLSSIAFAWKERRWMVNPLRLLTTHPI